MPNYCNTQQNSIVQHVTVKLLIFMCCLIRNFSEVQNPELKGANIHTTLPVFSGDNKNL